MTTPTKLIYFRTINTGKFENAKVGVEMTIDAQNLAQVDDAFEGVRKTVDGWAEKVRPKSLPVEQPTAQSTTRVETKARFDVPVHLNWRPFPDNKPGHWIFSNEAPTLKQFLLTQTNKTIELDGWKYRLSGKAENLDKFIQRFPASKKEASK